MDSRTLGPNSRNRSHDLGSLVTQKSQLVPSTLAIMGRSQPAPGSLPFKNQIVRNIESGGGFPIAHSAKLDSEMPGFRMEETSVMTRYGPGILLKGSELLTDISTNTTAATAGSVIRMLALNPRLIPSTRLSQFANLYTRFIFKKIHFEYQPVCPTTTAGGLMSFADYDPTENPSTHGAGALKVAYAHKGAQLSAVYERQHVTVTDADYDDMLYTEPSGDLRWSLQGQYWVLAASAIDALLAMGNLVMHYECVFAVPNIHDLSTASDLFNASYSSAATNATGDVVKLDYASFSPVLHNPNLGGPSYIAIIYDCSSNWPEVVIGTTPNQDDSSLQFTAGQTFYLVATGDPPITGYVMGLTLDCLWDDTQRLRFSASGGAVTRTLSLYLQPIPVPSTYV